MPPRTSKRAARVEQELLALQKNDDPALVANEVDEEVEEEQAGQSLGPASAFAAVCLLLYCCGAELTGLQLALDDGEDDATSEPDAETASPASAKRKKKRKKAKKPAGDGEVPTAAGETPSPAPVKRAAPKEKIAPLDEIDAALRELDAKYAVTGEASDEARQFRSEAPSSAFQALRQVRWLFQPSTSCAKTIIQLLSVDMKHLDADAELKRMFGAKVVNAAATQTTTRGAKASNPHHRAGKARSGLAKPGTYWPPVHLVRSGLTMEPIESIPSNLGIYHSFEHSRAYRATQSQFLEAVSSHDPNSIMALLSVNPCVLPLSLRIAAQHDAQLSHRLPASARRDPSASRRPRRCRRLPRSRPLRHGARLLAHLSAHFRQCPPLLLPRRVASHVPSAGTQDHLAHASRLLAHRL